MSGDAHCRFSLSPVEANTDNARVFAIHTSGGHSCEDTLSGIQVTAGKDRTIGFVGGDQLPSTVGILVCRRNSGASASNGRSGVISKPPTTSALVTSSTIVVHRVRVTASALNYFRSLDLVRVVLSFGDGPKATHCEHIGCRNGQAENCKIFIHNSL